MVVAQQDTTLLTACENGFGKRTPFGFTTPTDSTDQAETAEGTADSEEAAPSESTRSTMQYRCQKRGGKGLRDIKTSERNGSVIGTLCVAEGDDVLMMSADGKIQRIRASDISQVGRNTQGVRIIRLSEGDKLVSLARIPAEVADEAEETEEAVVETEEPKPTTTDDKTESE